LLPWYEQNLFPLVDRIQFLPVSAADLITSPDVWRAKVDGLIGRATLLVADVSTPAAIYEFAAGIANIGAHSVLGIVPEGIAVPANLANYKILRRPSDIEDASEGFVHEFMLWLQQAAAQVEEPPNDEAYRLLREGHYAAAVLAAARTLEGALLEVLTQKNGAGEFPRRSFGSLLRAAVAAEVLPQDALDVLIPAVRLRNELAHSSREVDQESAADAVTRLTEALRLIRRQNPQ
jgi:HEPN domain-containing protein